MDPKGGDANWLCHGQRSCVGDQPRDLTAVTFRRYAKGNALHCSREKILSDATGKVVNGIEQRGNNVNTWRTAERPAFLSVRREFIGEPERLKQIFLGAATDLKRERSFQGAGLIDLMRAIQSV